MPSALFNLVARAKAYAQRNSLARHAARQLEMSAYEFSAGKKSRWQLEQSLKNFQNIVGQDRINQFEKMGGSGRYGVTDAAAELLRSITRPMGQIGTVIQNFFDRQTTGYQARQVQAAVQLLKMTGIQEAYHNSPQINHTIDAAMEALEDHGWSVEDTLQTMQDAQSDPSMLDSSPGRGQPPGGSGKSSDFDYYDDGMSPYQRSHKHYLDQDNVPRLSKKHFTPGSSNVYAFQFDFVTSTLYVQFKAPAINSKSVTNYIGRGGMKSMAGDMGKTISGKTDSPGPLYAYFDVPNKVYKKLIAAQSAGKAVWDMLRVRGSVWGHQYRYSLVAGADVPGENGETALYVPRKAVQKGYRSRSVAIPGMGPRRYANSTLPQDLRGHATIRAMRHRPSRGIRPHRGRPDMPDRGR